MGTGTDEEHQEREEKKTGVFGGGVRRERAGSWAWVYLALFGDGKDEDTVEQAGESR